MRFWLVLLFAAALITQSSQAALSWKNTTVDLQAEAGASQVVVEYAFTNTGDAAVTITDITTGCDCTTAEIARRTFLPNETGSIKVIFRLGDRVGEQRKTITLRTDDAANPQYLLGLNVSIPQLWLVSPRFLYWRQGQAPNAQEISIHVAGDKPHKLVAAEVLEGHVKAFLREDKAGKVYTLIVTPLDTKNETRAMILVRPEDNTLPLVPVIYAAVILESPAKSATTREAE